MLSIQSLLAQIPVLEWVQQMGGTAFEEGHSLALDSSGNIYITGHFCGIVDFDPGTGVNNLTCAGAVDIFIQKLDSNGNFLWVKQMGGTGFDNGLSIAVDDSGNVYTTGNFEGIVDFDPGEGLVNLTSAGSYDIFVQKLDADGNFIWAKQMGGGNYDQGRSIVVNATGNVYTTGIFYGISDFNPGAETENITSAGDYDVFVQKLDANGNFIWAKQIGGAEWDQGNSIAIDASQNIFITGYFIGTSDFDPGIGTAVLSSTGSADIFVQKLDANGNFLWVKQMGAINFNEGLSVTTDSFGNVYTTGYFEGTSDFDPGEGTAKLISDGSADIFIQKLDVNGNFIWAKQMGGADYDFGHSIVIDISGNVYTTGRFSRTADFDPSIETANLISAGKTDIFVQKLDINGNFLWARRMGGSRGDVSQSIAVDASGNVYTTGWFQGTSDFDPYEGTTNCTSAGSEDIFIQKLYPCYPTNPVPDSVKLPDISVMCEIVAMDVPAPTSTSNCVGTITATTDLIFPITDQSVNQIDWIYDDKNGNVVIQSQVINWIPIDATTSLNGDTIYANNGNGIYQWLDCDDNHAPILEENNQLFIAKASGNYAVQIRENGCSDTSVCNFIIISNINETDFFEKLSIYPNPSINNLKVEFGKVVNNAVLEVNDIQGKLVFSTQIQNSSKASIELNENPGIYTLTIKSSEYHKTIKFIKK